MKEFLSNPEYRKLELIGGHKVYHLEGNALVHSQMVYEEACRLFDGDPLMTRVAALHDIGKIYTAIKRGENDWVYPDHALCGSFRGVLCKFISEDDPDFETIQWYIANHIKPLFWKEKGIDERILYRAPSEKCTIRNLAGLALCDVRGSISVEPQVELENYLENIWKVGTSLEEMA